MKLKIFLISITAAIILFGCKNGTSDRGSSKNNKQSELIRINPLEQLKQVDNLLSEIAEKPQKLNAPSDEATTVTGKKGTVIYVDPNQLETVDGSPIGDSIEIELLEMTDNSSLLLNNTQTVSDGQILVTGGAYYLNMTTDGKQLKMKQEKGLKVEFPQLTENEMELFLGERDSLGQIDWTPTNDKFQSKDTREAIDSEAENQIEPKNSNSKEPTKPIEASKKDNRVISIAFEDSLMLPELQQFNDVRFRVNDDCEFNPEDPNNSWYNVEISKSDAEGEYVIVFEGLDENREKLKKKYEVTPVFEGEDYDIAMEQYEAKYNEYIERKAEIEKERAERIAEMEKEKAELKAKMEKEKAEYESRRKTYEAVELMNFGWINCDRFSNDPNPKVDIQLLVNNDSLTGARMYAVFKDINSILTEQYWDGRNGDPTFRNIPTGKELHIIALTVKGETPYIFEKTINTERDREVNLNFVATTHADIKEKMERMN